jgi:ATP-binding cassette, subfamily C, bacterial
MALVGLGEGMSVALLLPMLSVMGLSSGSNSGVAGQLLDGALLAVGATSPVAILVLIVVISIVQTGLFIGLNWCNTRLARRYQAQRQAELFRAIMSAKWRFVVNRKAGELTNAIVIEGERFGTAFTIGLSIISTAVVMLTYLALSLLVAWQVTLCLIVFAVLSATAIMRLYRQSYRAGKSIAPLNAELQSTLSEQFTAFKIIKATASEDHAWARINPLLGHLEKALARVSFLPVMVRGLLEFLAVIGLASILVLASKGLGISIGNVFVVVALFARLFPRITAFQGNLHYLNGYVHGIDTINQLQSVAEAEAEDQDSTTRPLPIALPTSLVVRNLAVELGERKVLDRVDVRLPIPGMLAIVGGSGAGKSTLVHTLLGLIEPSAGSITLEKHEIHTAPLRAWRRMMGYAPQETMLFHASVRENLTLANPSASAAEIELAVRRAHALEFIAALPKGLDTIIGDQGVKLSGGQRQRLGIARALLTKPAVLLLDEAMSALDAQSEAELLHTLNELRKEMGILLVAHRLAAARTADVICVFEGGRVVEAGSWNELMSRKKRLYALVTAQSLVEDRSVAAL